MAKNGTLAKSRSCNQAFKQQSRLRLASISEIVSATAACWDPMERY